MNIHYRWLTALTTCLLIAGCTSDDGQPYNTGSGKLVGGAAGAGAGALANAPEHAAGGAVVADAPTDARPPPPQYEAAGPSPGPDYVWIGGSWVRLGGRWVWTYGHWVPQPYDTRAGVGRDGWTATHPYVWSDGHWR